MLRTIQAGRGLAAMAVAAFHLSVYMGMQKYGGEAVFYSATRMGGLGVDFFFVLSGFIILHAHAKDIGQRDRVGSYLHRRFARLYPVYWLYTIGFLAAGALSLGALLAPGSWQGWVSSLTLVRFSPEAPPLAVAWTLFHEVAFYGAFALLIVSRAAGAFVLAAWGATCLILWHYPDEQGRTAFMVYTSLHNLNFLLGMGAYWLSKRADLRRPALIGGVALASVGLGLGFAGVADYRIVFAIGCALLVGGLASLESTRPLRVPAVLTLLGDASYTVYLVHTALQPIGLKLAAPLRAVVGLHATYVLVLAATTAVAVVIFKVVEVPLLRIGRGIGGSKQQARLPGTTGAA